MESRVLETNESRRRHRGRITFGLFIDADRHRARTGYVYACPRCSFTSRTMKHAGGAEHAGDRHALECPADGGDSSAALELRKAM